MTEVVLMDYSDALRNLKAGRRVARSGWNGKGMWLKLVPADKYGVVTGDPKDDYGVAVADRGEAHLGRWNGDQSFALPTLPWIGMKTADDKFVPWLCSQTDMLAEDWGVVE